jgi:hypothetical protein
MGKGKNDEEQVDIPQDMKSKVQPSQHNHDPMVKKLEKGAAVTCVDAKCSPSAKHTASRTSWLHTRKESRDVPVNFP